MLIRVERKWLDKPFAMGCTNLIKIGFNATLKEIRDICKVQILGFNEWEEVKDINPTRFEYIDSEGFRVICDIYINDALERHLEEMRVLREFSFSKRTELLYDGYKMALQNEGYDCKRLEGMLDAYAKLKNSR